MRPAHTQLGAGGVEFDAAKGHGDVESNDFLSDEVVAWSEGAWDSDGDGLAGLWRKMMSEVREGEKGKRYVRTSAMCHCPFGFFPSSAILNHLAVEASNLSQLTEPHDAM